MVRFYLGSKMVMLAGFLARHTFRDDGEHMPRCIHILGA